MTIYSDLKSQKRKQAQMKFEKDPSAKKGYEDEIHKLWKQTEEDIAKYRTYEIYNSEEPVVAYVMLRSMEGKARLIKAYEDGNIKRWLLINCCCSKRYKKKLFLGDWLEIKLAQAPDIINWENLGASCGGRCIRITLTTLFSIALIVGTFAILLITKYYQT
jgi:hypothetical protein